jgi:hypothetical protein
MPKRVFRVREGEPLLDIVSYGRGGPREHGGRFTTEQLAQISRTVQRVPEVMVKVLPRWSNDLRAAGKHLDYISRHGELKLEADDGDWREEGVGKALLEEWDLDIDDVRRQASLTATRGGKPPKLIHKLMFSMPAGTPPEKVLAAVRNFAREEFWGEHRYAFVLHTDEDHPHVHLVLKSMSERGVRLNIRKVTLRHWRSEFARNLRLLGVAANATERAVRGEHRVYKLDGIYRADRRGASTHMRARWEAVAKELQQGELRIDRGSAKVANTRHAIERGWQSVSGLLVKEGHIELAANVQRFIDLMLAPRTEKQQFAHELRLRANGQRANALIAAR